MKFPHDAPVTEQKLNALKEKVKAFAVDVTAIEVKYIRASGSGGQKVNKTSSGVYLYYPPEDIAVKCTKERSRALNRFLALRELIDQIEFKLDPANSKKRSARDKIRRKKAKKRRRAAKT